jgi:predicted NAD-dependent protein-ADP-ribosyltransferase YbiA (DUF1768 family)
MSQQVEKIKNFVDGFLTSTLLPLAEQGVLDEATLEDCVTIYAQELNESQTPTPAPAKISSVIIKILPDNEHKILHPNTTTKFIHQGKEWLTLEHFIQAARFIGADEEIAESIRNAATVELAQRRGINNAAIRRNRPNWDQVRDQEVTNAVASLIEVSAAFKDALKATNNSTLICEGTLNDYCKEHYGKILMTARDKL